MKKRVSMNIFLSMLLIISLFPVVPSHTTATTATTATLVPTHGRVSQYPELNDNTDFGFIGYGESSVFKFNGIDMSKTIYSAYFVFDTEPAQVNGLINNLTISLASDYWPGSGMPTTTQSITKNGNIYGVTHDPINGDRPRYKVDVISLLSSSNIGGDGIISLMLSTSTFDLSLYDPKLEIEYEPTASTNTAPVLNSVGNKSVNEGSQLSFTTAATDAEGDSLTYSLVGAPSGASINATLGAFTWTPTEAQGPGSYTFKVRVSDGALTDEEAITVTVNEVNVAPVLGAIGNKMVDVETQLTFTAIATDMDIPENTLTYSLVDAPSGASINATSGAFTWTPTEVQGPGSYTFKVRVSDGVLTDEETITVTVNKLNAATPSINTQPASQIVDVNGIATLSVDATVSDSGLLSYQWYSNLTNSNSGGTLITGATGSTFTAPTDVISEKYYYVIVTNYYASASGVKTASTASDAVNVTVNTPLSFTVSETGTLTFDALIEGYSTAQVNGIKESVTLTKVGNGAITGLAVSFRGGTSSSFMTGTVLPDSLGAGVNSTVLQVFPKLGLAPGTHTETVTITANGGISHSFEVSFTVNLLVNAAIPVITAQPVSETVDKGKGVMLSVGATVSDNGTLSYQWYSNTTNSTIGGTAIPSATSATYTAPTTRAGTTYYYVVVTNTDSTVTGKQTTTKTSVVVKVEVNELTHATSPSITTQPTDKIVSVGSSAELRVAASASGTLSYQWYSNTTNSTIGGTGIPSATSATYTAPTTRAGTSYYYVVVTNMDSSATGNQTATTTSAVVKVQINAVTPPTEGNIPTPSVSNDDRFTTRSEVTIILQSNGGTIFGPIEIRYNTKVSDLPVPTRAGYRFDGWYQDAELTKQWNNDTLVRRDIFLYAKWSALPVEKPEPEQPQVPEPKPVTTFSDLEQHWAQGMIEELTTQGIIQGYEDGSFRPNASISRMHVAVLLARAFSLEPVREVADFSDVPSTHRYYEAIHMLKKAGIIDGSNSAFHPNEKMTRAQLAKVLVGILGMTPEGTSSFADVASTHWSAGYIAILEREGIAIGDNGYYHPNVPVTRAQFVTFLYRIMELQKNK